MDNITTNTSNDESRNKARNTQANTNEVKPNYVSDEEVKKDIEEWDEGKGVFVAAIDWVAELIKENDTQDGTNSASDSTAGGRKRRIRVGSKASKDLNTLITDPLVTVGTKPEKGKFKKAREDKKSKRIAAQKDRENKEGNEK